MDKQILIQDIRRRVESQMDAWRNLCVSTKEMSQHNKIKVRNYVEQLLAEIPVKDLVEAAYLSDDVSMHHILQQMSRETQRTRVAALSSIHVQEFNDQLNAEDTKIFDLRQSLEPQISAIQQKHWEVIRPYPILESHLQEVLDISKAASKAQTGIRNISMPEEMLTRWIQKTNHKSELRKKLRSLKRVGLDILTLKALVPIANELVKLQEQLKKLYSDQIAQEKIIAAHKQELLISRDRVIQEANLAKSEDTILKNTSEQIKALLIQYPKKWLGNEHAWLPTRIESMEQDCLQSIVQFEAIEQQQVQILNSVHVLNDWLQYVVHSALERSPHFLLLDFQTTRSRSLSENEKELIVQTHQAWFDDDNPSQHLEFDAAPL